MDRVKTPQWEQFEQDVQEMLGLSSTIASGSKHYDQGDAVDKRHHSESSFRFIADAKHTAARVYQLEDEMLRQWVERARRMGRRFCLPIRFGRENKDYVVLTLNDFAELLEVARKSELVQERVNTTDWQDDSDYLIDMATYGSVESATERLFLLRLSEKLLKL